MGSKLYRRDFVINKDKFSIQSIWYCKILIKPICCKLGASVKDVSHLI